MTKGVSVGVQNLASFSQTKNERWGKLGRIHEEDVHSQNGPKEKNGLANNGREERGENLEDYDLGFV